MAAGCFFGPWPARQIQSRPFLYRRDSRLEYQTDLFASVLERPDVFDRDENPARGRIHLFQEHPDVNDRPDSGNVDSQYRLCRAGMRGALELHV